ncbi:MAG: spondin domain-containing protein [Planctomycetota bacterium]
MQTRLLALGIVPTLALATAVGAQSGTAIYELTFDSTWSATTHPVQFPSNPHFSPPIGGTHNSQVRFWEVGGLATTGMERMAELGSTSSLRSEVNAAISGGDADQVLQFSGLGTSPSSRTVTFTVDADYSQLTLVTMLAPSPDWFVGVGGLELRPNGVWVDDMTVPLIVWDAGTDSGTTYTSPNSQTTPQDPIAQVDTTAGPFQGLPGPVGSYFIRRLASSNVFGCGINPDGSMADASGTPHVGATSSVFLQDTAGALSGPVQSFVAISAAPLPTFPCGASIVGLGLAARGTPGEVLILPPFPILPGPALVGGAARFDLPIPSNPLLVAQKIYLQGVLVDATRAGLTNAIELGIGTAR